MIKTILVAAVLFGQTPESSPELQEAQTLYDRGTSRYDAADYTGAIEAFTQSLTIVRDLPDDDTILQTRLQLLYNIARAHEKAYAIDKDTAHLRQALQLYKRYSSEMPDTGESLDAEVNIARVETKLRTLRSIEQNKATADTPSEPPPAPTVDKPESKRRKVGIGLLVSGSAFVAGGVGVLVYGGTFKGRAERDVDTLTGGDVNHPAHAEGQDHIDLMGKRGGAVMGIGGVIAAIGLAQVIVGAIQVRKGNAEISLSPSYGRAFTGLVVSGRF